MTMRMPMLLLLLLAVLLLQAHCVDRDQGGADTPGPINEQGPVNPASSALEVPAGTSNRPVLLRVLDEAGKPVAGARVAKESAEGRLVALFTNADGETLRSALAPGQFNKVREAGPENWEIYHPAFAPATARFPDDRPVQLTTASLEGQEIVELLLLEQGKPVAGLKLRVCWYAAVPAEYGKLQPMTFGWRTTGDNGEIRLPRVRGLDEQVCIDFAASAYAPARLPTDRVDIVTRSDQKNPTFQIAVRPRARITLEVDALTSNWCVLLTPVPLPRQQPAELHAQLVYAKSARTTDRLKLSNEGLVILDNPPPGRYRVRILGPAGQGALQSLIVFGRDSPEPVKITCTPPLSAAPRALKIASDDDLGLTRRIEALGAWVAPGRLTGTELVQLLTWQRLRGLTALYGTEVRGEDPRHYAPIDQLEPCGVRRVRDGIVTGMRTSFRDCTIILDGGGYCHATVDRESIRVSSSELAQLHAKSESDQPRRLCIVENPPAFGESRPVGINAGRVLSLPPGSTVDCGFLPVGRYSLSVSSGADPQTTVSKSRSITLKAGINIVSLD